MFVSVTLRALYTHTCGIYCRRSSSQTHFIHWTHGDVHKRGWSCARAVLSYIIPWPCTKIDLPCVLRRRAGPIVAHNTIASQSTITLSPPPVQNTLYTLPTYTTSKRMFSCDAYKRNFQSFLNDRKRAFVCAMLMMYTSTKGLTTAHARGWNPIHVRATTTTTTM